MAVVVVIVIIIIIIYSTKRYYDGLYEILTDFQNYFTVRIGKKIGNNIVAKDPTTPQVCHYTTL